MGRSVVAVVVGFVVWTVVWLGSNAAAAGLMPGRFDESGATRDPGALGGLLAVSVVASVLAGVVCALIARRRAVGHALVLGGVLLVVGIGVQAGYWDSMPLWYHLVFLGLLVPATVAGGVVGGRGARG